MSGQEVHYSTYLSLETILNAQHPPGPDEQPGQPRSRPAECAGQANP